MSLIKHLHFYVQIGEVIFFIFAFTLHWIFLGHRGISVGIVTSYGLGGLWIETRTCPDRPWGPPSLLYIGYQVFPGGKAAGVWR
jgi:hypothetical protein